MALTRSLSTGSGALQAQQRNFDVISNNLANTNTTGYKASRTNFVDQLSQVMSYGSSPDAQGGTGVGGTNPTQIGLGVGIGSITMNMTEGTIETTDRPLDMALNGDGYFIYNENGQQVYSRDGAVTRDKAGNLVDSNTGAFLQGYNVQVDANGRILKDADGNNILNRSMTNVTVPNSVISPPHQTENVTISGNLNADAETSATRQTSISIYDNQGATKSLNLTFTKSATANEYTVSATLNGKSVAMSATTVKFNTDGTLNTPLSLTITGAALNTATGTTSFDTSKSLAIKLADANSLTSGLTQYAMSSTATLSQQDGYEAGSLNDLSVDKEGKIIGAFSNGQSEVLGQVVIAKFANPAGLMKEGDNFFSVSPNSGAAVIGTAGEIFPSTSILGNALEASNVDLTEEFTNMITAQRSFEAASRIVTVSDQLLQETTNLKR